MTEPVGPGQALVAQNWNDGLMSGLEDFGAEDLKLARLVIDQKAGLFKDSLSGTEYEVVHAITLGVVKQRVMWQATVEDDSNPLCKSTDNMVGYPTTWDKPNNNFPWLASGWQQSDFPQDEVGRTVLPCNTCRFTQWKTHPDGKKPWCSMQHAVPLLYSAPGDDPYIQAVFTFQRSSLPASQAYFAGFMQKSLPAFSAVCEIKLNKMKRGQNDYYVPQLRVIGQTDQERWFDLSESYKTMRGFLTRPPVTRDENGQIVAANIATDNTIQAQPAGFNGTWVPTAEPVATVQSQPAQPVQTAPIAQPVQSPIAQPVVAQPVTPAQQVAQQQPVAQVFAPQQPLASVIPTVQATPAADDDLPF